MPDEQAARIGIDLERHRLPHGDRGDELFRNRQLHAQLIDSDDHGHLRSARHEVSYRDEAFSDKAREWRARHRVGQGLVCKGYSGARRLKRLILLRRRVSRALVLLAGRLHLRPSLIELGLRHDALLEQRLDAVEIALGQLVASLGRLHLRYFRGIER